MNLHPRFDQALLRLGKASTKALDRIDCEDGGVFLIVRVKVRSVVRFSRLKVHADDDAEEA